MSERNKLRSILIASFFAGLAIDFIFNGVLKIVWIAIYGSVYLTLASGLYSRLHERFGDRFGLQAGGLFLLGCVAGHLFFVGRREMRAYDMTLISDSRIILQSPLVSQTLYVDSDGVMKVVGKLDLNKTIPITVEVIKDYGCIFSFKIATVAGFDVMNDQSSTWVWKKQEARTPPAEGFAGLNEENSRRFWCEIRWF